MTAHSYISKEHPDQVLTSSKLQLAIILSFGPGNHAQARFTSRHTPCQSPLAKPDDMGNDNTHMAFKDNNQRFSICHCPNKGHVQERSFITNTFAGKYLSLLFSETKNILVYFLLKQACS